MRVFQHFYLTKISQIIRLVEFICNSLCEAPLTSLMVILSIKCQQLEKVNIIIKRQQLEKVKIRFANRL
jgi:hypothetical protein